MAASAADRRPPRPPIDWTFRRLRRSIIGAFLAAFLGGSLVFVAAGVRETSITVNAWNDVAQQPLSTFAGAAPPVKDDGPTWTGTERVNILLMGVDFREDEDERYARTDSMLVISFDPRTKQTGILSLPRDLWVPIPIGMNSGTIEDRINTTFIYAFVNKYPGGGPALAKRTVSYNLGVPIHYAAWIDFDGFVKVVDRIGGITVDVQGPVKDNEYPTETYGIQRIYFAPGLQRLDGQRALIYARTRHQDSDIFRANRQQQVIIGARNQAMSLGLLPKLPQLIDDFRETIKTDMSPAQVLALARSAKDADPAKIVLQTAPSYSYTTSQGASIQLFDRQELRRVVGEVFGPPADATATPTPLPR